MERKNGNITTLMLGASTCSEGRLSRLIPHLRQATVVGFSAMTLLILAFPARAAQLSFTTVGVVTTSTNITGPGTPELVFGSGTWHVTTDGIGCVVFPGDSPGNVCGSVPTPVTSGRFNGSAFVSSPGPVPGGGNYVLMDGSPDPFSTGAANTNTATLYYTLSGLTAGQQYVVRVYDMRVELKPPYGLPSSLQSVR